MLLASDEARYMTGAFIPIREDGPSLKTCSAALCAQHAVIL